MTAADFSRDRPQQMLCSFPVRVAGVLGEGTKRRSVGVKGPRIRMSLWLTLEEGLAGQRGDRQQAASLSEGVGMDPRCHRRGQA